MYGATGEQAKGQVVQASNFSGEDFIKAESKCCSGCIEM